MNHLVSLHLVGLADGHGQLAGLHIGRGEETGYRCAVRSEQLRRLDPPGEQAAAEDRAGLQLVQADYIRRGGAGAEHAAARDGLGLDAAGGLQAPLYYKMLRFQGLIAHGMSFGNIDGFHSSYTPVNQFLAEGTAFGCVFSFCRSIFGTLRHICITLYPDGEYQCVVAAVLCPDHNGRHPSAELHRDPGFTGKLF